MAGVLIAAQAGLRIPLVYNTGGYDSMAMLKLLDGVIDIYMPDVKYSDNHPAGKFSQAPDYWDRVTEAVKEMHRQVGDLAVEQGAAKRGLLVRHLVLPNNLAGSFKVLDFLRDEVSRDTYVNIMDQYRPCFEADAFGELSRRITRQEYSDVVEYAGKIGLHRGF